MSRCSQQQQQQQQQQQRQRHRQTSWLLFLLAASAAGCCQAQFLPVDCQGSGPAATQAARATAQNDRLSSSSSSDSSGSEDPFFQQPHALVAPAAYYINRTTPVPARRDSAAAAPKGAPRDVHAAAVCAADAPFVRRAFSMTTCRLFVRTTILNDIGHPLIYYCSAWFISAQHAVTAGHCIAEGRKYIVDRTNPGFVCCRFGNDGKCHPHYRFRLQSWVTTRGFLSDTPSRANDGAVLQVVRQSRKDFRPPIPQPDFGAFRGSKPPELGIYMDGYPMQTLEDGCGDVDEIKRYQTVANRAAQPINSQTQNTVAVQYQMSGCAGMSGGRVLSRGATGSAFGLQTFGYEWCKGPEARGRGTTGVTFITDSSDDTCGVCLKCLMNALQ